MLVSHTIQPVLLNPFHVQKLQLVLREWKCECFFFKMLHIERNFSLRLTLELVWPKSHDPKFLKYVQCHNNTQKNYHTYSMLISNASQNYLNLKSVILIVKDDINSWKFLRIVHKELTVASCIFFKIFLSITYQNSLRTFSKFIKNNNFCSLKIDT